MLVLVLWFEICEWLIWYKDKILKTGHFSEDTDESGVEIDDEASLSGSDSSPEELAGKNFFSCNLIF